jgi:hypothetical protein
MERLQIKGFGLFAIDGVRSKDTSPTAATWDYPYNKKILIFRGIGQI